MKKSNKKGFTLLEMLLAVAITLLISGLFISLIVSIRASYYRAYNDADCADIAQMYAQALENQILYDAQNGVTDKIEIVNSVLKSSANTNLGFDTMPNFNNADNTEKWDIRMLAAFDPSTNIFYYRFYFIDKYVNPGYLHYVYDGSFWIPNYPSFTPHNLGAGDLYDTTAGGTYSWDYNYVVTENPYVFEFTPLAAMVVDPVTNTFSDFLFTADPGTFYERVNSDSMGRFSADESSTTVSVPAQSVVINIKPAGT